MPLEKPELADAIFLIPPLAGAFWGARHAEGRTRRESVTTYISSAIMGVIFGAAAAEYLHYGPWVMGGVMFTTAAVGNEVLAYVVAALRQATLDPAAWGRKWIDAVLGRREP